MHPRAKIPITDTPKVWVCGSPYVDGNSKLVSAIMKNQKNGSNAPKMHPRAKLPIINPSKVWVCGSPLGESVIGNFALGCIFGALEPFF